MDAQSAALLEKLAQAPDDIDLHLVVADQLTEMGDPRGELITLQVALDRDPNNRQLLLATRKHIERHRKQFLAPLQPSWLASRTVTLRWRLGFVYEARVCKLSWPADSRTDLFKMLEGLFACPSAALLRVLTVFCRRTRWADDDGTIDRHREIREQVQKHAPQTLTELRVPPLFNYQQGELIFDPVDGHFGSDEITDEQLPVRGLELDPREKPDDARTWADSTASSSPRCRSKFDTSQGSFR
jgi:uncharacterized protein (TIGR02996 family)